MVGAAVSFIWTVVAEVSRERAFISPRTTFSKWQIHVLNVDAVVRFQGWLVHAQCRCDVHRGAGSLLLPCHIHLEVELGRYDSMVATDRPLML